MYYCCKSINYIDLYVNYPINATVSFGTQMVKPLDFLKWNQEV